MKILKQLVVKMNLMNILSVFFYIFRLFPIKNNKIIFINYHGKGYGDGGKYIAEQLLDKDVKIYWAVKDMNSNIPSSIKKIKMNSISYFYHLSTSKVWVNNSRFPQYIRKRNNQYYIQIWHGCLALKKVEFDAYDKMTEYYKKWMLRDTKMTNLMVSNSDFCNDMYRRAFKYNGEILNIGTPRNDILINYKKSINNKVRKYYNISENDNILVYAPTFRLDYSTKPYDIDFEKLKSILEKDTNKKWKILIRLHPIIKNPKDHIKNMSDFINATDYPDMQELIIACNILVTDYSSTMFESMIANKKVILYTKDLDDYNSERGTYFNIKDLPFISATNNKELIQKVKEIDKFDYDKKYKDFKEKIGLNETGRSSEIVANRILEITNGDYDGKK